MSAVLEPLTEAQRDLVVRYRPLAWKIARRYLPTQHHSRKGRAKLEVLRAAAEDGLIAAAKRFDPGRDIAFGTFARHWVVFKIRHWLFYNKSVVRPLLTKRNPALRNMDAREVTTDLDIDIFDNYDGANTKQQLSIEAWDALVVMPDFEFALDDKRTLAETLKTLNERELNLIHELYVKETTLDRIGELFGCSRQRVQQLRDRALEKVRDVVLDAAE